MIRQRSVEYLTDSEDEENSGSRYHKQNQETHKEIYKSLYKLVTENNQQSEDETFMNKLKNFFGFTSN